MAVSSEPRMELLPEEWEAIADLEAAARALDGVNDGFMEPMDLFDGLREALARLDVVRGRRAPVRDDELRNRGIRSGMTDG